MSIFSFFKNNNSENIFFFDKTKPEIDVKKKFNVKTIPIGISINNNRYPGGILHVRESIFISAYYEINKKFNPNFEKLIIDGKTFLLTDEDQEEFVDFVIMDIILYKIANRKKIKASRWDFFTSTYIYQLNCILEERYAIDKKLIPKLGAHIMRISERRFRKTVAAVLAR